MREFFILTFEKTKTKQTRKCKVESLTVDERGSFSFSLE
jgi:hypothetical protein